MRIEHKQKTKEISIENLIGHKHIGKTTNDYMTMVEQEKATIKLNESALKSFLRHFNKKSIYFYMQGVISCRNTIHKAKINYNEKEHKLTIYDTLREDTIIVELDMAYQILTNKKRTMLEIRIDNDEIIKLQL